MSKIKVVYSKEADRDLEKLNPKDADRIVVKIAENTRMQDPLVRAKALKGHLTGLYRYRIGDYRAIFEIDGRGNVTLLTILNIKHRKDIYK